MNILIIVLLITIPVETTHLYMYELYILNNKIEYLIKGNKYNF